MLALFVTLAIQIGSILLLAAAMWGVGRLRKADPRRHFLVYVGITIGAAVTGAFINTFVARVKVDTIQMAIGAQVVGVAASLAATAMIASLALGIRGKRVFLYVGAYALAGAALLAVTVYVIRPHLIEAFVIPTDSMAPTVVGGDRFLASKWRTPQRWDVVVFDVPDNPAVRYVKRVVALPGETLVIKDGQILINGQPQPFPTKYIAEPVRAPKVLTHEGVPFVVPSDRFFLLGDNTEQSLDSRFFGPIDRTAIVGVAEFTYWPLGRWQMLR